MKKPAVIAHRGDSAHRPENTLAAFERALQLGVDMIELDVRFTADRRVAVIHDATLRRTAATRGKVAEWTLERLQTLDAGSWFSPRFRDQTIPSLEQVCGLVRPSEAELLIEIKAESGVPAGFDDILIALLGRERMLSRSILQSFDHRLLAELKLREPNLRLAALFDSRTPNPIDETRRAGACAMALRGRLARPRAVSQALSAGVQVFVWTVNGAGSIRRMFELGIDGVITNHPDRALRVRTDFLSRRV